MNFYALAGLINWISATIFGVLVFFKGPKKRVNQVFGLMTLSIAIWSFSYWNWLMVINKKDAFFWIKILNIGSIFIPVFYLHWILLLLKIEKKKKKILFFSYLFAIIFLVFNFTPLFIKDIKPTLSFRWWPVAGIIYSFYLFSYFYLIGYGLFQLIKNYRIKEGYQRAQIKYVILATIIGFIGGATNFPLWYDIPIPPIGNILVALYPFILSYAILKYRLMDIQVVIKRSTVFSVLVIIITAAYTLAAFLLTWFLFGGVYNFESQLLTGIIVAILVAVGYIPFYNWLKKITDSFLFKGDYLPQELIAEISDTLSRTLELKTITETLKEKITQALRLKEMEIVILDDEGNPKLERRSKKKNLLFIKDIISFLKREKYKKTLILEELERKKADRVKKESAFTIIDDLKKLKIAAIVPLFIKEKLVGMFLLSAKKSGDMFTNEDIKTLETIAAQAAIAVENASLYEKTKNFSKVLQKEVERQTKSLREANIKLQELDRAKSEFLSLASHQLRTPLTAIKGYISMLLEGFWGNVNEKQEHILKNVYLSNERLIKLVEDLLTVSRLESGRLRYTFRPISLERIVEEMVRNFKPIAEKKGLYLKYIKPEKLLPKVKADSLKIRQVIQVLIENSIHYTKKGGATIHFETKKGKVVFVIQDTGVGISPEDQLVLFEKFSRGKGMSKMYTEGTGLGLYLAAKFVKAHHGRIWVKSEGIGKGSTFYVELPVIK